MKNRTLKILWIMTFLLWVLALGFPLLSAGTCPDDNNVQSTNLPCEILTPPNIGCSDPAIEINMVNSSQQQNVTMALKYPATGVYNFTFNFTDLGFYYIQLCDNSTAVLRVYDKDIVQTAAPVNLVSSYTPQMVLPYNISAAETKTQAIGYLFGDIGVWAWSFIGKYWVFITIGAIIVIAIGLRVKLNKKRLILEARR
jgi:hypothetical protein